MFYGQIKILFRNLARNRVYSFINIVGVALGITAFVLILQYVSLEESVNRFHARLPQMYRVLCQSPTGESWPQVEPGWAAKLSERFPEIGAFCRFEEGLCQGIVKNESENIVFREQNIGYVESNFFEFFSFPLVVGNTASLKAPDVAFISKSAAQKYFGEQDPLGRTLVLFNQFGEHRYRVEGVYADMGENSDIRYDLVFSLETLKNPANLNGNGWANLNNLDAQFINLFFLLNDGADHKALEKKMSDLRRALQPEKDAIVFRLQPFGELHLASDFNDDLQHTGDVRYVYLLAGTALLILLIAWFNYINLSTATALKRSNEVGVRKVIGATRSDLIGQFLAESVVVNGLAFALALGLIALLQPYFNDLIGKELGFSHLLQSRTLFYGLGLLLPGSVCSGIYTAWALSRFNPVETLKGKVAKTGRGIRLRQSLVVAQFSISITLILFTILILSQLKYLQNKNLGMNIEQLLAVQGPDIGKDSSFVARRTAFWNELSAQSSVLDYCNSGSIPGRYYNFTTEGFTSPKSQPGDEQKAYSFAIIDNRFLRTYDIPLKAGRNFTPEECTVEWNDNNKVLLNERAVEQLGLSVEEALNVKVQWDERALDVIGVVKDYHHTSLQRAIDPIIFYPQHNNGYFTIRLSGGETAQKIAAIEKLYKTYFLGNPFEYFFVDENFQNSYLSELRYGRLFTTASLWAVFIACMGLFGLATFMVESKIKEIGVRKVLGASVLNITGLLTRDFLKLVFMALFFAAPVSWYIMRRWLSNFAYSVEIQLWMFVAAGGAAVLTAALTVGLRSLKAALANPVESLRSE
jgi:putative ABC transport system permease protein